MDKDLTSPSLSVIIPSYNSGKYLPEAVQSVRDCQLKLSYEIVICDDGSTDPATLQLLENLREEGCKIIYQENSGPAAARNSAIRVSNGAYLLLLDSDNKIRLNCIEQGLAILTRQPEIGVVYGNPYFFGATTLPTFKTGKFQLSKIIDQNYIDTCSIIRKSLWEQIGPFDESPLIKGHEDWDYWIRVGASHWNFCYVDEIFFDYRLRSDSLLQEATQLEKNIAMRRYLYAKHVELLVANYHEVYHQAEYYKQDRNSPFRSFVKFFVRKYLKKTPSNTDFNSSL